MKRKIVLIIMSCIIGYCSYAQDQGSDTRESGEKEVGDDGFGDSLELNSDESNPVLDSEAHEDLDFVLPENPNDNVYFSRPSRNVTGNPGPSGNGAYDVDGKLNGDLDPMKMKNPCLTTIPEIESDH